MRRILSCIVLWSVCSWGGLAVENVRDMILVAGQSNAVGFDSDGAKLPPDGLDSHVLFWWRCGDPPPDKYDSACGAKWMPLQPQPKGTPMARDNQVDGEKTLGTRRQYGNFANAAGFGPEIGLARALRAAEKKPLAIVKVAFSGTGMSTDWNPDDPGEGGQCYRALIRETRAALAEAKAQGIVLRLRALVWVQGENDATAKDASKYEKRLGEMLAALRRDLDTPQLIVLLSVNARFKNNDPYLPKVVRAQQALAAKDPLARYVDCEGAHVANPVHLSAAGTLEIGKRFAEALLNVEAGKLDNDSKWRIGKAVPVADVFLGYSAPVPPGMVLVKGGSNAGKDPDFGNYLLTVAPFCMDKHEVSKGLWDEVHAWAVAHGYEFDKPAAGRGPDHPVHSVSWYSCVKWCNARSEKEGRTPCYTVDGKIYKTGAFKFDGSGAVQCNFDADGYRLPTATEWEYAARGGLDGKRFPWGDTITHSNANYLAEASDYPYDKNPRRGGNPKFKDPSYICSSPEGSFPANGYGLYDMAGNVWEWCWDAWGSYRQLRGGGWNVYADFERCGDVNCNYPDSVYNFYGFRTVCGVKSGTPNQ